jgi:2-hydroxy-6-oxonona-2,4-dienedioate hydrolase
MSQFTESASSKFVQVTEGPLKNTKIHYNDIGEGEVVVMLHGSGPGASGWSNFHRNIDALANAGYRVVLVDSPGWSKSDPIVLEAGTSRTASNAAAVAGVLDAIGAKKAHLVGNSMGGASALHFAVDYPERLGKLVVMGGGAARQSLFVPQPAEGIKLINQLYHQPTMENLKRMLNVFVYDPSKLTPELVEARFENMMKRRDHLENFVASLKNNPVPRDELSARIGSITSPALVIWGRDDRFVPLDAGLRIVWTLQDAQMHIFSQCGHWAQWEHADKFNRLVLSFLGN